MVKRLNFCWETCSVWGCNLDQTFRAVVVQVELSVLALLLPAEQVVGVVSVGEHRWRPPHHQLWWRVRVHTNVYRHWGCWKGKKKSSSFSNTNVYFRVIPSGETYGKSWIIPSGVWVDNHWVTCLDLNPPYAAKNPDLNQPLKTVKCS